MTGIIKLTLAGTDTGPFDLYSNADNYTSAFESSVTKAQLLVGFPSINIPVNTTTIKIKSTGLCTNFINVIVPPVTCYNFLPTNGYYTLSYVYQSDATYIYGSIDGYIENDIFVPYKNLVKLN
jgi:hypothetical protein